jgi:hypothetical protein
MTIVIRDDGTIIMIVTDIRVIGTTILIIVTGVVRITVTTALNGSGSAIGSIGRSRSWQKRGRDLRASGGSFAGNVNKPPGVSVKVSHAQNGVKRESRWRTREIHRRDSLQPETGAISGRMQKITKPHSNFR